MEGLFIYNWSNFIKFYSFCNVLAYFAEYICEAWVRTSSLGVPHIWTIISFSFRYVTSRNMQWNQNRTNNRFGEVNREAIRRFLNKKKKSIHIHITALKQRSMSKVIIFTPYNNVSNEILLNGFGMKYKP